jgi:predicted GNAT family acetyltransferase
VSSVLRSTRLRVEQLDSGSLDELTALVDAEPVVNVALAVRLAAARTVDPARLGGLVSGVRAPDGRLLAAAFHGANLVPVGGGTEEWRLLGEHLAGQRRLCSSIVGPAEAVAAIWAALEPGWGSPRALRTCQPLLVLPRGAALPPGDPRVRAARTADLAKYVPAAAAMFTEELGISPYRLGPAIDYRRRVEALVAAGRAFVVTDDAGEVVFKADIGAVTRHTCQVQGVWIRPDRRGRGLAAPALAAVLRHALRIAPTASLYVNDFNVAARRTYDRLGFRRLATLSTILF